MLKKKEAMKTDGMIKLKVERRNEKAEAEGKRKN